MGIYKYSLLRRVNKIIVVPRNQRRGLEISVFQAKHFLATSVSPFALIQHSYIFLTV